MLTNGMRRKNIPIINKAFGFWVLSDPNTDLGHQNEQNRNSM